MICPTVSSRGSFKETELEGFLLLCSDAFGSAHSLSHLKGSLAIQR